MAKSSFCRVVYSLMISASLAFAPLAMAEINKAAQSLALFAQAFGERVDANVQRKHRDRAPPLVRSSW